MKTLSLENVRQAARRIIAEVPESDDVAIVRTIGAQVDPEVVNLDGRDLAVRVLKAIVPPIPAEPCPCAEAKALDARVDAARRKLDKTVAELQEMRADRIAREAEREAERVAREAREAEARTFAEIQAQLDAKHAARMAERDRLAVAKNDAILDAQLDQRIAETKESLREIAIVRSFARGRIK